MGRRDKQINSCFKLCFHAYFGLFVRATAAAAEKGTPRKKAAILTYLRTNISKAAVGINSSFISKAAVYTDGSFTYVCM